MFYSMQHAIPTERLTSSRSFHPSLDLTPGFPSVVCSHSTLLGCFMLASLRHSCRTSLNNLFLLTAACMIAVNLKSHILWVTKDKAGSFRCLFNGFKGMDSLHVPSSLTASCSRDTAVDILTCLSSSLVLCLFFFSVSACVAAEPETSEEEGMIQPISRDPDTRALLVTVCSVSIMPSLL